MSLGLVAFVGAGQRHIYILVFAALFFSAIAAQSEEPASTPRKAARPTVRVIHFIASDLPVPKNARQRISEIVSYTQAFYAKWMKHWGYVPERPMMPFAQDTAGKPDIVFVKGQHALASNKYSGRDARRRVIAEVKRTASLSNSKDVLWIFVSLGTTKERGWGRGGGNFRRGGVSTYLFPAQPGKIDPRSELAGGFLRELKLKGALHELGHAFGLPHFGPSSNPDLGNSLMGPTIKAYVKRNGPKETRVYLSRASAAMLWKHPVFRGSETGRDGDPKWELIKPEFTHDPKQKALLVSGKVKSDVAVHSVVVIHETRKSRTTYWCSGSSARLKEDGSFALTVKPLDGTDGQIRMAFCFDNCAVQGVPPRWGVRSSGLTRAYRFVKGTYVFADDWGEAPGRPFVRDNQR